MGTIKSVNARLAAELAVAEGQVAAAVRLLDEGSTVPFIARYRKEVTGSLDDGQLRALEERLAYLREMDQRREAVLASIEEQGKLTDELRAALLTADTKSRVEDIYLPYKPKRRTKAQIAREAGLEEVRRAPNIASANLEWRAPEDKGGATLTVRYNGRQKDLAFTDPSFVPVRATLDDYTLVNLSADWTVARGISVFGRVENILNDDYEDLFSYATPGRAAYAGVRLKF